MGESFPNTVSAAFKPERGSLLTDFLHNNRHLIIMSDKTKVLFENNGLNDKVVEYLPFILINPKGRAVENPQYYVANPLLKIRCMDTSKSEFRERNAKITSVKRLHVLPENVPEDVRFFRLEEFPQVIIFRSDLIEAIKKEELTGLNLTPMGEKIY